GPSWSRSTAASSWRAKRPTRRCGARSAAPGNRASAQRLKRCERSGDVRTSVVPAERSVAEREPGPITTGRAIWRNREECGHGSRYPGPHKNRRAQRRSKDGVIPTIFVGARREDDTGEPRPASQGAHARRAPPVRLLTSATIFVATASISWSVIVFSRGCRVTAIAIDFLP